MATSSIFHDFVITDTEAIERYVNALEQSYNEKLEREKLPQQPKISHEITDPNELRALKVKLLKKLEDKKQNAIQNF